MARYFIALCALTLFAAAASAAPLESDVDFDFDELEDNAEISFNSGRADGPDTKKPKGIKETMKGFLTKFKKYIKEEFIDRVHMKCAFEVPLHCGFKFYKAEKYYNCASNYFKEHKERCIKPKKPKA